MCEGVKLFAGQAHGNRSILTFADIVTMIEALLIERLEPRQNRCRGNDFQAVEYLQLLDPAIEKERDERFDD
jgi:hypothetical protein